MHSFSHTHTFHFPASITSNRDEKVILFKKTFLNKYDIDIMDKGLEGKVVYLDFLSLYLIIYHQ